MHGPSRFDPASIETFRVVERDYDADTRTVRLHYALDDRYHFEEQVTFETDPGERAVEDEEGFARALLHLHVAAGTSYYKTAAPGHVEVEGTGLSTPHLELHRRLYDDGLREFAVRNGLAVPLPVTVEASGRALADRSRGEGRRSGLVVPIGGGKDSMVAAEALSTLAPRLFAVDPHPLVTRLAEEAGLDLIVVRRRLDPGLASLNAAGALNGHVPITAIVSLVAVAASFVYGYDTIAMAIERSASEETRLVGGVPVNHQFSKSLEFERLLSGTLRSAVDPQLTYGSVLRPYSELAIARAFAGLTRYHSTFCSCNAAYRRDADADQRWCGRCPKCRFVSLVLAPFLDRSSLAGIIGRDLLGDPGELAGFAALMSEEDKPFECVGERRESAAALRLLAGAPGWSDAPVVAALAERARAAVSEQEVGALLTPDRSLDFPDPRVAEAVARLLETPSRVAG